MPHLPFPFSFIVLPRKAVSRAQACAWDMCWSCALHRGLGLDSGVHGDLGGLRDFLLGHVNVSPMLLLTELAPVKTHRAMKGPEEDFIGCSSSGRKCLGNEEGGCRSLE